MGIQQIIALIWEQVLNDGVCTPNEQLIHMILKQHLDRLNFNPLDDEGIDHIQLFRIETQKLALRRIRETLWKTILDHRRSDYKLFLNVVSTAKPDEVVALMDWRDNGTTQSPKIMYLLTDYLGNKHIKVCAIYRVLINSVRGAINNLDNLYKQYEFLYSHRTCMLTHLRGKTV